LRPARPCAIVIHGKGLSPPAGDLTLIQRKTTMAMKKKKKKAKKK
jgi:hypothetical protein